MIDQEQVELERLARRHERNLKFLRHTPREDRGIPISDEYVFQKASKGETVLWTLIWLCFAGFLLWLIYDARAL